MWNGTLGYPGLGVSHVTEGLRQSLLTEIFYTGICELRYRFESVLADQLIATLQGYDTCWKNNVCLKDVKPCLALC